MSRAKKIGLAALLTATMPAACAPRETGGTLVSFHAYAAGPADANGGIAFDTSPGFHVTLTTARMHIGAVYMRLGKTNPGSASSSCVGETTYGLEVPGPIDVDVLSGQPQEFAVLGDATDDLDQSGEIWLTGGDINRVDDPTPIVSLAGTAERAGTSYPFRASVTIGANRLVPPSNPAEPGASPICKQRIVAPIPLAMRPVPGGDLLLRIDPRLWLDDVDFSTLAPGQDDPAVLVVPDTGDDTAGRALFGGIRSASEATYSFSWVFP